MEQMNFDLMIHINYIQGELDVVRVTSVNVPDFRKIDHGHMDNIAAHVRKTLEAAGHKVPACYRDHPIAAFDTVKGGSDLILCE